MTLSTARALKYQCAIPALPQLGGDDLMPDLADYMTVQEAAEKLGFHVDHVRRMRRQGVLEAFKVGATWLISKESVKQYQQSTAGTEKHDPSRRKKLLENTETAKE